MATAMTRVATVCGTTGVLPLRPAPSGVDAVTVPMLASAAAAATAVLMLALVAASSTPIANRVTPSAAVMKAAAEAAFSSKFRPRSEYGW